MLTLFKGAPVTSWYSASLVLSESASCSWDGCLLQLNLSVTWQDLQSVIRQFHHNLHETAQHVQDPKALKESVKKLYQKHCAEDIKQEGMEEDIQKEYNRQREYLEKSVESLKRKLHKDMESHRQDNMRIMQENVTLIKEINELRREVRHKLVEV